MLKTFNPLAMILLHLTQQEVIKWHDDGGVQLLNRHVYNTRYCHRQNDSALNQEQNYT